MGLQDEVSLAENLFMETLTDWAQQEHVAKREKLYCAQCPGTRNPTEVMQQFEQHTLKYLAAFLTNSGDGWADTRNRVQTVFFCS